MALHHRSCALALAGLSIGLQTMPCQALFGTAPSPLRSLRQAQEPSVPKPPPEPPAPTPTAEVHKLLDACIALLKKNKNSEALQQAGAALETAQRAKDVPGQAWAQTRRAELLESLGRVGEAAEAWKSAEGAWEQAKYTPGRIAALGRHALLLLIQENKAGEAVLNEAVALAGAADEVRPLECASALNDVAGSFYNRRLLKPSEKSLGAALQVYHAKAPGSMDEARSLNGLGLVVAQQGDLAGAKTYHEQALKIQHTKAPGSMDEARSLNGLGNIVYVSGDLAGAKTYYEQALRIFKEKAPGSIDEAASLNNLGSVTRDQGNLAEAKTYHEQALRIKHAKAPGSLSEATTLNSLGRIAIMVGDLEAAKGYFKQALQIQHIQAPGSVDEAKSLSNLGAIAKEVGNLAEAKTYHEQARKIWHAKAPGSVDEAGSLNNLGNVASLLGDFTAAKSYYEQALRIQRTKAPGSVDEARSLNNLGSVASLQGDLAGAKTYHEQSLRIWRAKASGSVDEALSLDNLGSTLLQLNQASEALPLLKKAAATVESQRGAISGVESRRLMQEQYASIFPNLLLAHARLNQPEDAFTALERGRGRAFAETIAERQWQRGNDQILASKVPPALLQAQKDLVNQRRKAYDNLEHALQSRDKALRANTDNPGSVPDNEVRKQQQEEETVRETVDALASEQRQLEERFRRDAGRYASLAYPKPLPLPAIQKALPSGTLLLSYAVTEADTFLFAVSQSSFKLYPLGIKGKDLDAKVKAFRDQIVKVDADGNVQEDKLNTQYRPLSRDLYKRLLTPAAKEIAAAQKVLICPDGALHALPFGALEAGIVQIQAGVSRPLFFGEVKPLHFAPSATTYVQTLQDANTTPASRPSSGYVLALGDPAYPQAKTRKVVAATSVLPSAPKLTTRGWHSGIWKPLPATRGDVAGVVEVYEGKNSKLPAKAMTFAGKQVRAFLGPAATEANLLRYAPQASVLFLGCHGQVDEQDPFGSALALTPQGKGEVDAGMLRAWEVMEMPPLRANLVVLAACETGLGKESAGEGLLGLCRAFQYAGARSVLGSLWSVSDAGTSPLLKSFFHHLKDGADKDEALRLAVKEMANSQQNHPFYWAAFQLAGSPW